MEYLSIIVNSIINLGNDIVWTYIIIPLLLGAGVFFTYRLGFIQFLHFGHMFSVLRNSRKSDGAGISSFQALSTSLAARVGTGNLAGVAVAITLGGPGAIFWMWLIAIIGMATSFAESTLAQVYKEKDSQGRFRGGPAYYIQRGLGLRWLGVIFAVFLIFSFGLFFNAVQSNTIAASFEHAFSIPKWVSGVVVIVAAGVIIFGGLRTIARFAELVVPFMALAYLVVAVVVLALNINIVPQVIATIVSSALGIGQATGGVAGYAISQAMMNGIRRGLFSNEGGMGSAPNAAATATPYPPHPASQGYVQMLGVFIDTLVICTATATIILLSGEFKPHMETTGIQLTQMALVAQVGSWGDEFIAIILFFFAFTSIVANYSYAETNILFIAKGDRRVIMPLRFVVLGVTMLGSLATLQTIWNAADLSMALMATINIIAILLMYKTIAKVAKDYNTQRRQGLLPTFDPSKFPELKGRIDPTIWNGTKGTNGSNGSNGASSTNGSDAKVKGNS